MGATCHERGCGSSPYLLAAGDLWWKQRLLGFNYLPPLLELRGHSLHLLLLLLLFAQQLLALHISGCQPFFCRSQVEAEKVLTMEEPFHRQLGQAKELHQSHVHGALASLALLRVQAAESDGVDVLLEDLDIQLAHDVLDVNSVDPPPVHLLPAWTEPERKAGRDSAGGSHAGGGRDGLTIPRVLAQRWIQEGRDPRWRMGALAVTGIGVVNAVVKWLQGTDVKLRLCENAHSVHGGWTTHAGQQLAWTGNTTHRFHHLLETTWQQPWSPYHLQMMPFPEEGELLSWFHPPCAGARQQRQGWASAT